MIRALSILVCNVAIACPLIGGVPDYNCDGKVNVVILGDSIVYGTGDDAFGGKGGWPLRAKAKIHEISVKSFGIPGDRTFWLLPRLQQTLRGKRFRYHPLLGNMSSIKVKRAILEADYIFFYVGVNNYWSLLSPEDTINDLIRIRTLIHRYAKRSLDVPPLIILSNLWVPNRVGQGPWVRELNTQISALNSLLKPTDLRFNHLGYQLLNSDALHPSSRGYDAMFRQFKRYLRHTLPGKVNKIHGDEDEDGVYDVFETLKYGTDTSLDDTDGDGLLDGVEIFELETDPLDPNDPAPAQ